MNPADKRLIDLVDKWLASLELHLKYSGLDDASYWRVQPWVKHDRPSRWIIELARQKAQQLKEQIEARMAMGDAKFGDSLELMAFLSNLVGSQHVERFIPLAEAASEVDLSTAPPPAPRAPEPPPPAAPARAAAHPPEATQQSAVRTQPRKAVSDTTREMPRPAAAAAREPSRHASAQRAEARKGTARREHKAPAPAPRVKAEPRPDPEREKAVVADAVRLLGWGRQWHEIPDLISRMADRPAISEVRRILRDHKPAIERELDRDG